MQLHSFTATQCDKIGPEIGITSISCKHEYGSITCWKICNYLSPWLIVDRLPYGFILYLKNPPRIYILASWGNSDLWVWMYKSRVCNLCCLCHWLWLFYPAALKWSKPKNFVLVGWIWSKLDCRPWGMHQLCCLKQLYNVLRFILVLCFRASFLSCKQSKEVVVINSKSEEPGNEATKIRVACDFRMGRVRCQVKAASGGWSFGRVLSDDIWRDTHAHQFDILNNKYS